MCLGAYDSYWDDARGIAVYMGIDAFDPTDHGHLLSVCVVARMRCCAESL